MQFIKIMKVLGTNKKGTKILLGKNEAIMAFTPKGVETIVPLEIVEANSVEEAEIYVNNGNEHLNKYIKFMNLASDLQDMNLDGAWNN